MNGNDYFDFLSDELVGGLGLNWSLRDYKCESYLFKAEVSSNDVKDKVLRSQSVLEAIQKVCVMDR